MSIHWEETTGPLKEENRILRAEIERLRANLITAEFDRLANEAEIERLRAALKEISELPEYRDDESRWIAKRALKSNTSG